jgi:hypothetical protein
VVITFSRETIQDIENLIALIGCAIIPAISLSPAHQLRHEFIVPKNRPGLLYHRGKFAGRLGAGRCESIRPS